VATQQLIAVFVLAMLTVYVLRWLTSAATANTLLAPGIIRAVTLVLGITSVAVMLIAVGGRVDLQVHVPLF
jgi:hypothetical protein